MIGRRPRPGAARVEESPAWLVAEGDELVGGVVVIRVEVTDRDGVVRWLADPPHRLDGDGWWSFTDQLDEAGVWPWSEALELARAAHQPWRRQTARAVAVAERTAVGADARARAAGMGLPDPAGVRCLVFGPERVLVLRTGGREVLPAIAAA